MAKKVTSADMPQKKRDDELFAHEVESVREAVNTNADQLDQVAEAVVDAPTTAAEYVGQKGNSTLWRLGSAIRDKAKLRLQKFSAGTLPALLPAPVPAADRPTGVAAPGAAFVLSALIGAATPGPAAIAEYTRTVADGNHVVLSGSDLEKAQYPVYQNGYFYAATVSSQDKDTAAVRLPRVGAAFDAALCWAWTGAGLSVPVVLNTARVKWEQDVWAPGLTINIFGENLTQGNVEGGAGWVAIRQGSGPVRLYSLTAPNPYRAAFTVPASVTPGPLEYWYHNGHGGDLGWSAKRTVKVVAAGDHVLTYDFGQRTRAVLLDATDASLNVSRIRDAYQALAQLGGGTLSTPAGSFPLNDTIQPKDRVRWICDSVATGGVTTLTAAAWVGTGNLGMFGSNFWICGATDGLEFIKTSGVKLADAEAVVVLNNIDQVQLRRTRARWNEPYDTRAAGPVREAVPAQPLRLGTSKNVFFDDCANTGSGINLGGSSNVFFTNYTHRATHNADFMVYSNNMLGWCMIGYDLRDLDPTSTDGADRGIRCIKSGGQNGRNRFRHLEKGVGTDLGIVRSGTNQAPDDNQFEQDLDEYNITKYTDKVVRATAATVTIPRTLITQVNGQPEYLLKPTEHLVAIVAGRGVGQWRGIVSTTIDTITVDEPWLVVPDATSVLHTGWFSTDSTRYDVHYTAKPDNAQNPLYNHSSAYNGFGGVRGGIIDKCSGQGFRQGISFVATQHDGSMVDQTAFNVVRNSQFPNSRWGRRFEAMPGQTGWAFDVPGLYCNLFSNCTYEAAIVAKLVYQLPRDTAGQVANITMLVEENQPVDVGLNDFSPSFYNDPLYPPKAVIPGTLTNSCQLVRQALSVIGAAGTLLAAGGELGPLEPLPAGAVLDTVSGMLSHSGTDAALLVFVDGTQLAPLARTAPASTGGTIPAPGAGYTDAQIDALLAGKASLDANQQLKLAELPELLNPLAYPVMAGTAGGYAGYATLEAAAAGAPNRPIAVNVPRLNISQDVTLTGSLYAASLAQILIADGVTVTLNTGIRLQNIQFLRANGSKAKVAIVSTLGTGTVPDATQAVQLVDSRIGPDLVFSAPGHAITARGRSAIDNAVGNPGTIYLYDVAAAGVSAGGPTVVERRPGTSTGIDYANEVAISGNTLATVYKAYVLQGAGCTLTLPDAAAVGSSLFVRVDDTATGLFSVALEDGTVLAQYWAKESVTYRKLGQGWRKQAPDLRAMSAEIQTSLQQQSSVTSSGGNAVTVPFSVLAAASGPAGLADIATSRLVVQRAGRAALRASVTLKNVSVGAGYALYLSKNGQFIASANLPVGDFGELLAIGEVTKTALFAAGDVLTVAIYTAAPGNYRGLYDGSQAIFSFTEFV